MELHEEVEQIRTRGDLAVFIHHLYRDFLRNPDEWESWELADYLEALSAWTGSMPGYFMNRGLPMPEQPTWQLVGDMLYAAKYQE